MRLKKLRVSGFQSFSDSGELEFSEGINLIVGQNNSGKSALLRAMQPQLVDDRHRTPEQWNLHELPLPEIFMQISTTGTELKIATLLRGSLYVPIPPDSNTDDEFLSALWQQPLVTFDLKRLPNQDFAATNYPSHKLFMWREGNQSTSVQVSVSNAKIVRGGRISGMNDDFPALISQIWGRDMFYFKAERFGLGKAAPAYGTRLSPDASNLPIVLNTLQGSQGSLFQRLVRHLRTIFPTVGNLSVWTAPTGHLEILIWPTESMDRRELAFPLEESGTGVAQVIALLTAIMTQDIAVFIIDEINSFLHPAAVKILLRILQTEYSHHQYIISTHAPEVIGFSNPQTIHLVKRDGYETHVTRLDVKKVSDFRNISDNLGLSMADVFAADQVIWVEGPTEELCFPYLFERQFEPMPRGTVFSSVAATGDFNRKRDRELVYQIYEKVSAVAPSMQVRVVFSFDSEGLTDSERAKMIRESKGKLLILPRRHIECYLLNENAIAALILKQDSSSNAVITPASVRRAIEVTAADQRFHITEWAGDIHNENWLTKVDAAKIIDAVCQSESQQRVTFNKKEDSLFLLQFILEHDPTKLTALADYVHTLVEKVTNAGV